MNVQTTRKELKSLLRTNRSIKDFNQAYRTLQQLEQSDCRHLKLALLASYTTDFVIK